MKKKGTSVEATWLEHEGMKCGETSGMGGVRLGRTSNISLWSSFQHRNIESVVC